SIRDASWGLVLARVRYYGSIHHVPVVAMPAAYTSQECSGCGFRVQKSLSIRTPYLPQLRADPGSGPEPRREYPRRRHPYLGAPLNGPEQEHCSGEHFRTDDRYVAEGAPSTQVGWLNEAFHPVNGI